MRSFAATVAALLLTCSLAGADDIPVIVGFHSDPDPGLFAKYGGRATLNLGPLRAISGKIPAGKIKALQDEPGVAYVEEDLVRQPSGAPNDSYYAAYQADDYGLVNCPAAWDLSQGTGIRVAVLDTGCQLSHLDIGSGASGKVKAWKNFTGMGKSTDVSDKNGHGTHTAGTVGARTNNGVGVAGAGYACELAIGKVLGPSGGYDSWVAAGLNWSWQTAGARVVNLSLGGPGRTLTLENAVNAAWSAGSVLVAAAGNDGDTRLSYPAAYANCISVAATDNTGTLAGFSNHGSTVDLAAPGVDILSTYKGGGYAFGSGTSMASPHVAGVAALVRAREPSASNATVRRRLEESATRIVATPDGSPLKLADAYAAVTSTLP